MRHRIISALILVLLCGCVNLGEGTRKRVHLYSLQPTVAEAASNSYGLSGDSAGVGPIYLPDYLQRTQVVTLVPPNEYRLAEFASWAEPLEENILRVTAENLSRLLGRHMMIFPWRGGMKPDYRIRMDIRRFEAVAGEAAHLQVQWSIEGGDEKTPRIGYFEGKSPLRGEGTEAVVAAMSRALGDFSRRMAEELTRLAEQEKSAGADK